MEKAFDVGALVDGLKKQGLHTAEAAAKDVTVAVCNWLMDSVKLTPSPFDDVLLVVLPKLQELALAAEDKIDGEVSPAPVA